MTLAFGLLGKLVWQSVDLGLFSESESCDFWPPCSENGLQAAPASTGRFRFVTTLQPLSELVWVRH